MHALTCSGVGVSVLRLAGTTVLVVASAAGVAPSVGDGVADGSSLRDGDGLGAGDVVSLGVGVGVGVGFGSGAPMHHCVCVTFVASDL
jgi:hypothetical protein